ncbi:unnamed protein product [Acanthoscelides obtectus]|nr:unnamed protein product [Acanthoscelides obtectus]CAK1664464.1 Trypsin-2 [Acanthoscelides obtectus]
MYTVRAGSPNFDRGGTVIPIKKAMLHPWRRKANDDYDLAILEFRFKVRFSDIIKPVRLPKQDEPVPDGIKGTASGWGSMSAIVTVLSDNLRAITVPVMPKPICRRDYWGIDISDRQFCAGYMNGGRDTCNGDSGGPFVIDDKLYGIVSWGFQCARPGSPGVYTSIPALRDYIRINTGV